ncbi:MAG: hypothetical protein F4092_06545 [Rhodospirillaceae bacterium]|nr:hypothetical protein [Rhodospirillaceae bacterium]MYJ71420.1 hypothetical protein [Rhodospirillaceae bacterium]
MRAAPSRKRRGSGHRPISRRRLSGGRNRGSFPAAGPGPRLRPPRLPAGPRPTRPARPPSRVPFRPAIRRPGPEDPTVRRAPLRFWLLQSPSRSSGCVSGCFRTDVNITRKG